MYRGAGGYMLPGKKMISNLIYQVSYFLMEVPSFTMKRKEKCARTYAGLGNQ